MNGMRLADTFEFAETHPVPDDFHGLIITVDAEVALACYTKDENAKEVAVIAWNPRTKLFSPRWIPLCDVRAWSQTRNYMERG